MKINNPQFKYIQKIIDDEVWLESERRGYSVNPEDPIIKQRVSEIIIKEAGAWMRYVINTSGENDVLKEEI